MGSANMYISTRHVTEGSKLREGKEARVGRKSANKEGSEANRRRDKKWVRVLALLSCGPDVGFDGWPVSAQAGGQVARLIWWQLVDVQRDGHRTRVSECGRVKRRGGEYVLCREKGGGRETRMKKQDVIMIMFARHRSKGEEERWGKKNVSKRIDYRVRKQCV